MVTPLTFQTIVNVYSCYHEITYFAQTSALYQTAILTYWILDCFLFSFENRDLLMRQGASELWHISLPLMNSFNKTEAAIFPMPSMLSQDFPFFSDKYEHCSEFYFISCITITRKCILNVLFQNLFLQFICKRNLYILPFLHDFKIETLLK